MGIKGFYAACLCGAAFTALTASQAQAQEQAGTAATLPAGTANQTQSRPFRIPSGPLARALDQWAVTTGLDIVFSSKAVKGVRSSGAVGVLTPHRALEAVLENTGFMLVADTSGAYTVIPREASATPDILVNGRKSWSLNTGIERTQDDSQPFIVMTRDEIEKSGATDLESFIRNRLNVNTAPLTSDQAISGRDGARGTSSINLRGLGARDTLILVDGRRQPGVNFGNGEINQTQISGISLASIERIEVLASSASGIYGSGASGGVVNIILRRDFTGGELTGTYGDTSDFKRGQGQLSFTGGVSVEGGRTNISVNGSWSKTDPLLYGDRGEFLRRGVERLLEADPQAEFRTNYSMPFATTPNFRTLDGKPLRLKPQFGGQTLGSNIGTVPVGFTGAAAQGITPLLAGIGRYNYEQPDSVIDRGKRAPLMFGRQSLDGSLAVRRKFNDRLSMYIEGAASRYDSNSVYTTAPSTLFLQASSAGNPFAQSIAVTLPGNGRTGFVRSQTKTSRLVGGAIVSLPLTWQAAFDMSWNKSVFQGDTVPAFSNAAANRKLSATDPNILRDVARYPLEWQYENVPFGYTTQPGKSQTLTPSLRLAGPLWFVRLPGGSPQMTLNVERSHDRGEPFLSALYSAGWTVNFSPPAKQTISSLYGEITMPLIAENNNVPAFHTLELRMSARAERYVGMGGTVSNCTLQTPQLPANWPSLCPETTSIVTQGRTTNSRVDPSISLRWSPIRDLVLRGSYSTGNLPPRLSNLTSEPRKDYCVNFFDRQRGDEAIGGPTGCVADAALGGNPNIKPERSRTFTVGAILTPTFLPGLRFSADWTTISKRNNYFDPTSLQFLPDNLRQAAFDQYLKANPNRIRRGPASDGFSVGPINFIDLSLVNLVSSGTEALDFVLDYRHPLLGGEIQFGGRATYVAKLEVTPFPGDSLERYAGVIPLGFAQGARANGAIRWRGNLFTTWTRDRLSVSWQSRYFDSYYLSREARDKNATGLDLVSSQMYHDLNIAYRFPFKARVSLNILNIFNTLPPLDRSNAPLYYSSYADPRLRNFNLTVTKSF